MSYKTEVYLKRMFITFLFGAACDLAWDQHHSVYLTIFLSTYSVWIFNDLTREIRENRLKRVLQQSRIND